MKKLFIIIFLLIIGNIVLAKFTDEQLSSLRVYYPYRYYVVFDVYGNKLFETKKSGLSIAAVYQNTLAITSTKSGCTFSSSKACNDDYAIIKKSDIDKTKKFYMIATELPKQYENGFLAYKTDYSTGLLNKDGETILPAKYGHVKVLKSENIITSNYKNYNYFDKTGKLIKEITSSEYKELEKDEMNNAIPMISEKYIPFENKGKWGIKDTKGKVLTKAKYDNKPIIYDNFVFVNLNSEYYTLIDSNNKPVITLKEKNIYCFFGYIEGYMRYCDKKVKKCGYFDRNGKIAIQPQFDYAGDFQNSDALVQNDGKFGFINKKGEIIVPLEHSDAQEAVHQLKKHNSYTSQKNQLEPTRNK